MEKKKIAPDALKVNPLFSRTALSSMPASKDSTGGKLTCELDCVSAIEGVTCTCDDDDRDTKSQQEGTGSLCISVILCEPTEKNCDPNKSQGVCLAPTKWNGCQESVDNCLSAACFTPSVEYCLDTENKCDVNTINCGVTDLCNQPSVAICVQTKEDDCETY